MQFCLGIEIGGTKLQIAVGRGETARFQGFWRGEIDAHQGAAAIQRQIVAGVQELLAQLNLKREQIAGVGIAFGGPVDTAAGMTVVSHQVDGWERFPLVSWIQEHLGMPAVLQNDADSAALAEARFGAGRGFDPVLYVTVGSGIGGGVICDGRIYRGCGAGAVEIGHLRPGSLPRNIPEMGTTVESIASGFGITERARRSIANWQSTVAFARAQFRESSPYRTAVDPEFHRRFDPGSDRFAKLLALAEGDVSKITTRLIAQAAAEGDHLSLALLSDATFCIGWALAQAVTLLNPGRIVVGGGVALIGEELFFKPVRRACASQVFGPFAGLAEIVPAELGEEVVVHGALAVAAAAFLDPGKG